MKKIVYLLAVPAMILFITLLSYLMVWFLDKELQY